jgi:putative ABC transport system permease protein
MSGTFLLAWRYILHHKFKSAVLVASIVLTVLLPVTIKIMLWQFNQKVLSRADETSAIVGSVGSDLDLALNATYFRANPDLKPVNYAELDFVRESGLATPIPVHARFTAQKYKIVGTSLDYFRYRKLEVAAGQLFTTLGDCVLGNRVAAKLGLEPGLQIISDRQNVIAFGGESPLRMNVVGVLAEANSPDDWAVFVDVKTAWVIEGLGHGHEDLSTEPADSVKVLAKNDKRIIASAGVTDFIEITEGNLESFHFHGNTDDFPLTAIIAVADSDKNETLLEGKYRVEKAELQLARPPVVIRELMEVVFRVNRFFEANSILIAIATAMLLALVILLSMRLRAKEMETMFRLGCRRGTIAMLLVTELTIIFGVAAVVLGGLIWFVWQSSGDVVQALLVG